MSMEIEGCEEMTPITEFELSGDENKEEPFPTMSATNKVLGSRRPPLDKKYTSDCWNHYARMKDGDGKTYKVKCIHCGSELKYSVANGTSAMRKHLKTRKKFPCNVDKRQKFFALRNVDWVGRAGGGSSTGNVLSMWSFNQERCRQMLARFIIVDEQPFSLVEYVGFREFVTELQPLFKHLSRFTVAKDCMKLYFCERTCLETCFGKINYRIELTTDTWSSIQNLNYLCLIAHFIDENWKLHKRIINFVVMHSHWSREIGRMMEKCINEWGIEKKESTITMNNASSNDVAIGYLKEKLSRKKLLILDGSILHVRCTAYILNLIVRDGLTTVRESIAQIRNVVRYVRSSPMRTNTFKFCIKGEKITYKGSVILDVATRWNSTYLMLDTAIKFRKAFEMMEEDDPSFASELNHDLPKDDDWDNAIILLEFLKLFYDTTNRMSGSSYVTSNYFEGIALLYKYLKDAADASDPKLQAMGMKMKEKFDKYYGSLDKVNMLVLIGVLLDPSAKLSYVNFLYEQIYDDELKVNEMHYHLKDALERLYEFYEQSSLASSDQNFDAQSLSASSSGSNVNAGGSKGNKIKKYDIQAWRRTFMHSNQQVCNDNKSELDQYLEEKNDNILDLDLLIWWKSSDSKYKILSLMARDVLSIPVTTVASESTFSTSGCVLDGFRNSLTPKVVEALICTQDWLRAIHAPIDVEECIKNAEKFELDMDCLNEEIIVGK